MSPSMHVAVDGVNKEVASAWVAVDGVNKEVSTAALALDGAQRTTFDPGIEVAEWRLGTVAGNGYKWTIHLSLTNVAKATVRGSWRSQPLATLVADSNDEITWTSTRGSGRPSTTYRQWVDVWDRFGAKTTLPVLSFTTQAVPKPPKPTFSSVSQTSLIANGATTTERDSTQFQVAGTKTYSATSAQNQAVTGLRHSTRYSIRYRWQINEVWGPWSDYGSVTTDAPSYRAGRYYLKPSGSNSYAAAWNSWRPSSEGIRCGYAEKAWKSTRGQQTGLMFYKFNDNTHKTLRTALDRGAKVTKVRVYMYRRNTAHGYRDEHPDPGGATAWFLHGYNSAPSGSPKKIGSFARRGKFKRGQGKWVTLPNWMGKKLITGADGVRGLGVGLTSDPYYQFDKAGWGSNAKVEITIA